MPYIYFTVAAADGDVGDDDDNDDNDNDNIVDNNVDDNDKNGDYENQRTLRREAIYSAAKETKEEVT